MKESQLERDLAALIKLYKLPIPQREYVFDQGGRKWRFDFAWPGQSVAVEVEGGIWANGRHSRGKGFTEDCRKYNAAALQGWRVYRFTGQMVRSFEAIRLIQEALACA